MKALTELKQSWEETKVKLKQKISIITDNSLLLVSDKRDTMPCLSPTSLIVFGLLSEGKQDEMLGRLQFKLGKTKEEIYALVSEL